jgi:ribosomal protein S18 acetylase RimI-like enzyme
MVKIVRATLEDCDKLVKLSKQCFLESHGNSASKQDVETFINLTYSKNAYTNELNNVNNIYHLLYVDDKIAGYSKIVLNQTFETKNWVTSTKLDRLYLLKAYYGLHLGKQLLNFNIELSKQNNQKGMWLAVWIENLRAVEFYNKMGFKISGEYNFKISENHYNPNHIMYLNYLKT